MSAGCASYPMNVSCVTGTMPPTTLPVTLAGGGSLVLPNIPSGSVCTVSETPPPAAEATGCPAGSVPTWVHAADLCAAKRDYRVWTPSGAHRHQYFELHAIRRTARQWSGRRVGRHQESHRQHPGTGNQHHLRGERHLRRRGYAFDPDSERAADREQHSLPNPMFGRGNRGFANAAAQPPASTLRPTARRCGPRPSRQRR